MKLFGFAELQRRKNVTLLMTMNVFYDDEWRKRIMKKLISLTIALIMLLSLGVVSAESKTYETFQGMDLSNTEIDFWYNVTGKDADILQVWIEKFNNENPYGCKINAVQMSGDVITEKLPSAIATGTGPDMTLGGVEIAPFAEKGLILPIDEIFEQTGLDPADFNDGLLDLCSFEGHLYCTPFWIGVTYMYWNKDLYAQVGADPDKMPTSWQEVLDISRKIAALGDDYYGLAFPYGLTYSVYDVLKNLGADFIVTDPETNLFVNKINSQEMRDALTFWQSWYLEGITPVESNDDIFLTKKLGTIIAGPFIGPRAVEEYGMNVGFGIAPGGEDASYFYSAVFGYYVTKNCTTPEEKAACLLWMSTWNSTDAIVENCLHLQIPAHLKSAANDPRVKADYAVNSYSQDISNRISYSWIPLDFTHGPEVNDLLFNMLQALAQGGDLESTLTETCGYIDEIVAEANEERIAAGKAK